MKNFIFSLGLITFSGFAMDNSMPMTTTEKVSLLEAFRCGTLQVRNQYLQFPDIADQKKDYVRLPKDVHEYFKVCFASQNQQQKQTTKKHAPFENLAELERRAELEEKSFVKKIYPNGLMRNPQNTDISQFSIEEQEQLLQEMLRPGFDSENYDPRHIAIIEPTRKWMLALELGKPEVMEETFITLVKKRPGFFSKPLKETLQECAVQ